MTRQKSKKQKGGVISINDSSRTAFESFFAGSNIDFFSIGGTGIIFTCINNTSSEYFGFRSNNLATRVNKIILKLCVLHTTDDFTGELTVDGQNRFFASESEDEFQYEVRIQNDIVNKTCGFFEPVAPTMLYAGVFGLDSIHHLESQTRDPATVLILRQLNQLLRSSHIPGLKVGLIGMEHVGLSETFTTLGNHLHLQNAANGGINSQTKKQAEAIAIYELLILGYYGFCHGDHHYNNFLYSSDSPNYFKSVDGTPTWYTNKRVLPIDFGRANNLLPDEAGRFIDSFIDFVDTKNIASLITCIKIIRNSGFNEDHNQELIYHPVYRWFNTQDPEIAAYVHELYLARGRSIDETIQNTRGYVIEALNGSSDANLIKEFTNNSQMNPKLIVFVIKHILAVQSLPPVPPQISTRITGLQQTVQSQLDAEAGNLEAIEARVARRDEEERSDVATKECEGDKCNISGGGQLVGLQYNQQLYNQFTKLIRSLDLNSMMNKSCFAIISVLYSTGKFNKPARSFQTLVYGLELISIRDQKNEFLIRQQVPRQLVTAGGTRKRKRKKNIHKKTKRK